MFLFLVAGLQLLLKCGGASAVVVELVCVCLGLMHRQEDCSQPPKASVYVCVLVWSESTV